MELFTFIVWNIVGISIVIISGIIIDKITNKKLEQYKQKIRTNRQKKIRNSCDI